MRFHKFITTCAVASLFLGGCGNVQDVMMSAREAGIQPEAVPSSPAERLIADGACPAFEVVQDLSMIHKFLSGKKAHPDTLITRADITSVHSVCDYGKKSVNVETTLAFKAIPGDGAIKAEQFGKPLSLPFFVAVMTKGDKILAKEVFNVEMAYNNARRRYDGREVVKQIMPLNARFDGGDYKIVSGFQMDETQLKFNRDLIEAKQKAREAKAKADAMMQNANVKTVTQTITTEKTINVPSDAVIDQNISVAPLSKEDLSPVIPVPKVDSKPVVITKPVPPVITTSDTIKTVQETKTVVNQTVESVATPPKTTVINKRTVYDLLKLSDTPPQ